MQVTRLADMTIEQAEDARKLRDEYFSAKNKNELQEKMDNRLRQLEHKGEVLVQRMGIDVDKIPGVVERLTIGILGAHNKGQRRRMKREVVKLIESL